MVTAGTGLGRSGLSDWLLQRVSAVVLLAWFLVIGWVVATGIDYAGWQALFATAWMRIFTLLAVLSLAAHAWIGMWSVLTDYLTERLMGTKGNVLRIGLQLCISLLLFIYVIWGIQILWGN